MLNVLNMLKMLSMTQQDTYGRTGGVLFLRLCCDSGPSSISSILFIASRKCSLILLVFLCEEAKGGATKMTPQDPGLGFLVGQSDQPTGAVQEEGLTRNGNITKKLQLCGHNNKQGLF